MNEWPAAIWASVSAMIAALVLSLIFLLGSFAREAVQIQQHDDNAIAIVKEYREYSHYDGTTNLLAIDVMSAITESSGFPVIAVDVQPGTYNVQFREWTTDTKKYYKDYFKTKHLYEFFDDLVVKKEGEEEEEQGIYKFRYDASLVRDANGVVSRIEFRRQDNG
ncbi:hypothetical protein [Paenibacillus sp. L3-i20]|uniref:hypothetical protein n=1 Tax=Paenibacillus sp. L3-i20 TaxID=2905833 RepID=UPI001EDD0C0A|nr:hypothetical protein [Paenibacillus sp. L3-i20]GKU77572.1 hypothetical protein L3i20_v219690 [Paenibacillus sp. L3-i20]